MAQSPIERRLEEMGVEDDSWEWFDVDEATAPDRRADPDQARKHRDDPIWLRQQYVDKELSAKEIAEKIDASYKSVLKALHNHGIPLRRPHERNSGPAGRKTLIAVYEQHQDDK